MLPPCGTRFTESQSEHTLVVWTTDSWARDVGFVSLKPTRTTQDLSCVDVAWLRCCQSGCARSCHPIHMHQAGANAGYSEGDSVQQEARAGLEAGESDPAGATATARR
jgi:hypothetical protein